MTTIRNGSVGWFTFVCTTLVLVALEAFAQAHGRGNNAIESLIDEWNFANNAKNIHSFEKVYADDVNYYGVNMSRSGAIARKQQLFRDQPSFRQRITTEVLYSDYATGVTRAEFTREVYDGVSWRRRQSYLHIATSDGRYTIVGEGDGSRRSASQQMARNDSGSSPVRPRMDSISTSITDLVPVLPRMEHPDSVEEDLALSPLTRPDSTATNLMPSENLFARLSSGEVVVPRSYVFILVFILATGGLMMFVADFLQAQRMTSPRAHDGAEHLVRNHKFQATFEAFVVTLFDPLFFKSFRPKAEYVLTGEEGGVEVGKGPDLVIDYSQNELRVRFAVACHYYRHPAKTEVELPSPAQQESIRKFQAELDMEAYYVLGFGGRPDDPKELFFVPASDIQSQYITRTQLKQYSKSGMFYYNRRTGRIQ